LACLILALSREVKKGSDKVEIIGLDDKRKITGESFICIHFCEKKLKSNQIVQVTQDQKYHIH
jgi:hypothetical protein